MEQTSDTPSAAPSARSRAWLVAAAWLPLVLLLGLLAASDSTRNQPSGDAPHLLGTCMRLGWELRTFQLGALASDWFSLLAPHPPGAYVLPSLLYALLGPLDCVPLLASALCLGLLWSAALRLARATGVRGSWSVALFLAAAPLLWEQAGWFGFDLAGAACVACCLAHLVASWGLQLRREALRAGVWLGAGFGVKYTFPIYLLLPCLAVGAGLLWDRLRRRPGLAPRLRNCGLLLLAFAVTAGPLLVARGEQIARYVLHSLFPAADKIMIDHWEMHAKSPLGRGLFYLAALKELWGWPGLALLALGLALLAVAAARGNAAAWRARGLTLCCVAGGVLLLTFVSTVQEDRYLLPALAPLLVVALPPLVRRPEGAAALLVVLLPAVALMATDLLGVTARLPLPAAMAGLQDHPAAFKGRNEPATMALSRWGSYPLSAARYQSRPILSWTINIDRVLRRAAAQDPRRKRRVGLLARELGVPDLGLFLLRSEQLDQHWHFVVVKLVGPQGGAGGQRVLHFQGPFFDGGPATFPLIIAVHRQGDAAAQAYLKGLRASEVYAETQRDKRLRVLRVPR